MPNVETVYVARDGTGNYNCDGDADQVQINQALAAMGGGPDHNGVYLKGPATYVISDTIKMKSDTTLEGDDTACIKLVDSAGWVKEKPLITQTDSTIRNIDISGFEINGNHLNQGVDIGYQYYNTIYFKDPYNISIHNMNLHDNSNDSILIEGSNYNDVAATIYGNQIVRSGHEGIYCVRVKNIQAYNNTIGAKCNGAIRTYNSDDFSFHHNYIYKEQGGFAGFQIQKYGSSVLTKGEIHSNIIHSTAAPGIVLIGEGSYNSSTAKGIYIHHNVIYDTGETNIHAGILVHGWTDILIENNTIDSCYADGVILIDALGLKPSITGSCTITLRNNIISNTKKIGSARGYGITNSASGHSYILEYNGLWNNAGGDYNGVSAGAHDIHADPLFVDLTGHDYHLKSAGGRRTGTGWTTDTVTSPMIDAGHPSSNFSLEPTPNGGRINIGAYGGTINASKTPEEQFIINLLSNPAGSEFVVTRI